MNVYDVLTLPLHELWSERLLSTINTEWILAPKVKNLDVILNTKLSWKTIIEESVKKASSAFYTSSKMCHKKWELKSKMVVWIFTAITDLSVTTQRNCGFSCLQSSEKVPLLHFFTQRIRWLKNYYIGNVEDISSISVRKVERNAAYTK